MSDRYAGVREAYFSSNKPPPVPPKQATEYNTSAFPQSAGGRRHFSPSSSPSHPRTQSSGSPSHYTQFSHSIPRSRGKPRPNQMRMDRAVGRSTSFSHPISPEAPPTLPPRPVTAVQKTFKRAQPKFLTGDLSFEHLIKHYQKSFPLRVYITNGYLGATSRLTISTGDMYNIHFMKSTKVMLFKDSHDTPYSIPLNSAIEFGLLYQPRQGRKPAEIETGVVFSSVADLLSQPETPRVVVVLKSWQSSDGKTSVVTNEVLFVRGTQRSLFGKKGMKVFSRTTKSDKFLAEDCNTQFSTQPSLCRVHITDIVDHIRQPKGEKCVLFLNSQVLMNREMSSSVQTIPDDLFAKVLTILDQVTETSLIASSMLHRRLEVSAEDFDPDRDVLFDIPVDENTAEMTCAVVEMPDDSDTDRLYDDTKSLYEKFDPTKVMSIKDTGSENSHATQKLLYTTIRRGCEGLGVEIARPEALYDIIPSHMKSQFPPTPSSSASASPLPPLPPSVPPTLRSPTGAPEFTDNVGGEVSDGSSLEYDEVTPESLQLSHQSQMPNLHTVSVTRGPTQVEH
ncbi:hypothetical protein GBAR_LOCUS25911 [Geodia barretti]|uniref:CABIT domain-containing protein n=1 Tax=Geodia barretti TaxID=519541 RepID=A0AA35TF69_GEOBA|nr:hypothetical protein GBAR_LOCUS25911 [Geodia barretti]